MSKNAEDHGDGVVRNIVAVDLGAESCRVSLVREHNGCGTSTVLHRFSNAPVERNGHLFWDIENIVLGVHRGLEACAEACGGPINAIGVDGWAVDYVRLGANGKSIEDPFCYRDVRTEARQLEFWKRRISRTRIYELTGIQMLRFNTLYQLYADACDGATPGETWLNLPEYVLYRLGATPVAEYSNATHTQMVQTGQMCWCEEIFRGAGISLESAPKIVPPGTVVGKLAGTLAKLPAFADTALIAPSCHDTGAAVAGIPCESPDDWAFLISGTWSLFGTVLPKPCTTRSALNRNFSNEGGLGGQVRFLKNVNGMWLLQQCMREWRSQGRAWNITELIDACRTLPAPKARLDVDDPGLLLPGNMIRTMNRVLSKNGQPGYSDNPDDAPEVANLIFHSLADRYAALRRDLSRITRKRFGRLYVVGGGSRNEYLNELVAQATGLEVICGPVEASTVGNAAIQLAVLDGKRSPRRGVDPKAVSEWSRRINENFRFIDETPAASALAHASAG